MGDPWVVIVGNVGVVYDGHHVFDAWRTYFEYKEISKSGVGKASGEDVTIMRGDKILDEQLAPRCAGCGELTYEFYSMDQDGEYCEGCTEDMVDLLSELDPAGGDDPEPEEQY